MNLFAVSTEGSNAVISFISNILNRVPALADLLTTVNRWIFMFLGIYILFRAILSLVKSSNISEVWAYVRDKDGNVTPITHWENVIGRHRSCDIILDDPGVSRNHGLLNRKEDGSWTYTDLGSTNGTVIDGEKLRHGSTTVYIGDKMEIGACTLTLLPVSLEEKRNNTEYRLEKTRPLSTKASFIALTVFQLLTAVQFIISLGEDCPVALPLCMAGLTIVMWIYYAVLRSMKRIAFEMEEIAFFLSTLSLAVTATAAPDSILKQLLAIVLGICLFFGLCWYLRDLSRVKSIRFVMIIAAVVLLALNLIFGHNANGATNWVTVAGMSLQPSELVKICFIFAGAATLDEMFTKKNLTMFVCLALLCFAALAKMNDFGTAAIFFATFIVISFLRSGDLSKLVLIVAGALTGVMLLLRFKPYIADRFGVWGHVWEFADEAGFQQTRAMIASSSGGLVGLGAGNGFLKDIFAADTDLVFGVLNEDWGLVIASLAVLSIVALSFFAVKSIMAGRSTFYTICSCAAMTILILQVILNVLGSVDILPLTGVTFPFVSNGGTSMIVSWGLLAFLKASDTRQNASFAVRLHDDSDIPAATAGDTEEPYIPEPGPEYQEVKDWDDLF